MRRETSLLIVTTVVVVIGIIFYAIFSTWGSLGSSGQPSSYSIALINAYPISPVSVDNARWQIVLRVGNLGNAKALVNTIYVDGVPVSEKGLNHGDSLSSRLSIGTSVPEEGVAIPVGRSATLYLWIGSDKFTRGTSIVIEVQNKDSPELQKIITLN